MMELNFLLPDDLYTFKGLYPDAYRFLTQTNLLRERDYLKRKSTTNWQKDRLLKLDLWYANTVKPSCGEQIKKMKEVSMRVNSMPELDKAHPNADKKCGRCHGLGHYTALHVGEYDEEPVSMRCSCTKRDPI